MKVTATVAGSMLLLWGMLRAAGRADERLALREGDREITDETVERALTIFDRDLGAGIEVAVDVRDDERRAIIRPVQHAWSYR